MRPTLFYRRMPSPLHAARAGVAAAWAGACVAATLVTGSPLALAALATGVVLAGSLAGVGRDLLRAMRMAAVLAVLVVLVNVLVSRAGLTVFARLGDLGPFGQGDLTVEALVYGAVVALKLATIVLVTALAGLCVDPDELLRALRRVSFRSALTASLATRMVPLLAGDTRRLAEAQRTRSGGLARAREESPLTRARARGALASAVVASSLDRALDVAATLELRGFACATRPPRNVRPWSRHDFAFAASAAAAAGLAIAASVSGTAAFTVYPQIQAAPVWQALALGSALALVTLLPFAQRKGVEG